MDLKNIGTFVFDLDGTVWYWTRLDAGVSRTISRLRMLGKTVLYVTNNTIASRRSRAPALVLFDEERRTERRKKSACENLFKKPGCYSRNGNLNIKKTRHKLEKITRIEKPRVETQTRVQNSTSHPRLNRFLGCWRVENRRIRRIRRIL